MVSVNALSELGFLLGEPARAAILIALLDDRARTASELAECAGVTPQTASSHLARLLSANLIRVEQQGRHRYHRLASAEVARLLETMHVASAGLARPAGRIRRLGPADLDLRLVRSCYDHMAGRLAVELAASLLADTGDEAMDLRFAEGAEARLADWGLDLGALRAGKRCYCRPCLDWSERRPHLAGSLGAAILGHAFALHWLRRRPDSRALTLTPAGVRGFRERFGISLVAAEAA